MLRVCVATSRPNSNNVRKTMWPSMNNYGFGELV